MNTTRTLVLALAALTAGSGAWAQEPSQGQTSPPEVGDGRLSLPEAVTMALRHHPAVGQARAQRDGAAAHCGAASTAAALWRANATAATNLRLTTAAV